MSDDPVKRAVAPHIALVAVHGALQRKYEALLIDRDALRNALGDRWRADLKAAANIFAETGRTAHFPSVKEVVAWYVAEVERLEKRCHEMLGVCNMLLLCSELGGQQKDETQAAYLRRLLDAFIAAYQERDALLAKLDRAKEALSAAKNCIGVHCPQGVATPLAEHTYAVIDAAFAELSDDVT
jgi:hypothetical protein